MKKLLLKILTILVLVTAIPTSVSVTAPPLQTEAATTYTVGWIQQDGKWYYVANTSGARAIGWLNVEGKWYYLNSSGVMTTGWQKIDDKWYYLNSSGVMTTGWQKVNGYWYFLNTADGHMMTGWTKVNGKWYYLKSNGRMVTGPSWRTINKKVYYVNSNGTFKTGWAKKNSKWYYYTTNANMVKGSWLLYNGKYYYLKSNGVMATGKVTINGKTYKFSSRGVLTSKASSSIKAAAAKATKSYNSKVSGTSTSATTASASKSGSTITISANTSDTSSSTSSSKSSGSSSSTTTVYYTSVTGKLNDVSEAKRKFVLQIANYVRKYAPQYGIKVYSPIIAQAILESGWGQSSLAYKYHNYFGLKCGTLWTGKSVNLATSEEFTVGTYTKIRDNFRVYDNMEEGVKGYFQFIQMTRYSNLKGVTSPQQYLTNIKKDGYATSSTYVKNCMNLVTTYNLTQFDK